jgi:hypothetical protein
MAGQPPSPLCGLRVVKVGPYFFGIRIAVKIFALPLTNTVFTLAGCLIFLLA